MKKLISLSLAVILALSLVLPVTARAAGMEWIELLEYSTVNGVYNDFSYATSRILTVPMPRYMRICQVDILLSHTSNTAPDKVEVSANGTSWSALQVVKISDTVTRVIGNVGNSFYSSMQLRFTRSSSVVSYVDVKSFKLYTLPTVFTGLTAGIGLTSSTYSDSVVVGTLEVIPGVNQYPIVGDKYVLKATSENAYAYDYVNMSGYVNYASIGSIRAMYGKYTVPFEVSFLDIESGTIWHGKVEDTTHYVEEFRDYYFSITVDLTNIDRLAKSSLEIIVAGEYNNVHGVKVMVDAFKGGLVVADESDVWAWNRFSSFIAEKFTALGTTISTGFSNVSSWISSQTTTLNTALTNVKSAISTGFTNVSTWISNQTTSLNTTLNNVKTAINTGFTNVGTWIGDQTASLVDKLNTFEDRVSLSFTTLFGRLESYFGVRDEDAIDDLDQSSGSISQGAADIHDFEQSQQDTLNTGFATIQNAVTFTSFANALVFVQRYANMTVTGISKYTIVFTLPLFLGLFFYLCSRVPGVTRWKSRPPKSKGGGSP